MKAHWVKDGEPYCETCAVRLELGEGDLDSNETDCPENCHACDRLCNYTLTDVGQQYVIGYLMGDLDAWLSDVEDFGTTRAEGYYKGMRSVEVLRDWAEDLKDYGLDRKDKLLVDLFLRVTDEKFTSSHG